MFVLDRKSLLIFFISVLQWFLGQNVEAVVCRYGNSSTVKM